MTNNITEQVTLFEYKPLATEMDNYDEDDDDLYNVNHEISNDSEIINPIEEEKSNCASFNSKRFHESIESLHSLRISRSVSGKKTNERTLLERMHLLYSNNQREEIEDLQTPKKETNKKVIIGHMFDYSSTENKKVMVSELDIQINSTNKLKSRLDDCYHGTRMNTFGDENRKNLFQIFEDNKKSVYLPNCINLKEDEEDEADDGITIRNIAFASNIKEKKNTTISIPTPTPSSTTTNATRTVSNRNKNDHGSMVIHKLGTQEGIEQQKKKPVCSSMKKISSKKAIFDILLKINDIRINSLSKQRNNLKNTPVSNLSTACRDSSIKKSSYKKYNIPINKTKPFNPPHIPITTFRYKESQYNSGIRTSSVKDTNNNTKRDGSIKIQNSQSKNSLNKKITLSNSRSKSKQKTNENTNNNYSNIIYQTIQSLNNTKVKSSLLNTLSNTFAKKTATKAYFSLRHNNGVYNNPHNNYGLTNRIKKVEMKPPYQQQNQSHYQFKKNFAQGNQSYLNTESDRLMTIQNSTGNNPTTNNNDTIQSYVTKVNIHTPINNKPHYQIYKNNIKNIMITPVNSLKMKLLEVKPTKMLKSIKRNNVNNTNHSAYTYLHLQTDHR